MVFTHIQLSWNDITIPSNIVKLRPKCKICIVIGKKKSVLYTIRLSTHLQSILPKHPKLLPLATRREYETVIILKRVNPHVDRVSVKHHGHSSSHIIRYYHYYYYTVHYDIIMLLCASKYHHNIYNNMYEITLYYNIIL